MPASLTIRNLGQIKEANLNFGDLTVLVGPQASGKSIALQWLKLVLDTGQVQSQLKQYGLDWDKKAPRFLDLYLGEGMQSIWANGISEVGWNGVLYDPAAKAAKMARGKTESVFLIPAQRVLTLRDGWPRPFSDFAAGDPFAVRSFSEMLRLLMEKELGAGEAVFPKENRLKKVYRQMLEETIFRQFQLTVDKSRSQKRLILGQSEGGKPLPYMVWSAGQREFVPLLLGLYWLMPPAKVSRRNQIKWVIIEEPEMGMHPRAISTVLLLVLELLERGYKVCISTHSPQVLDLVWVLQTLKKTKAKPAELLRVFGTGRTQPLLRVAEEALRKSCRVYYFDDKGGIVHDITDLDPSAMDDREASWGGMLDFSSRANDAVAAAMSEQGSLFDQ